MLPLNDQWLSIFCAFAAGAIPFGWIIAKLWGVSDLRKVGSTNTGATNVVRTAGVVPGALTFLLDYAKAVVPMVYLPMYFPQPAIWLGVAAVVGHCYSPFLKFNGGKGVSTTLGALTAFNPWLGAACILIYGGTLGITRVSALGSLFAMLAALSGAFIFTPPGGGKIGVGVMVLIVLARHRPNWDQLLAASAALVAFVISTAVLTLPAPSALAREKTVPPGTKLAPPLLDFRGKAVVHEPYPTRVAALIPSLAEVVMGLGVSHRLTAAPDYTRIPKELEGKVAKLGPYNSMSAEVVYATKPDLVLASMDGNEASLVHQLEALGLRVLTVNTQSLDHIMRSVEIVAAALGEVGNPQVTALRKALQADAKSKTAPRKQPTVFVQIGWEPLVTISRETYIDELVHLAGGKGVFDDAPTKYPRPNPEEVIARDPDVIIICKLTDDGPEAENAREFWMRFKKLKAVKAGRVYIMPVDWLTKPGFHLMDGMRELRRILS